MIQTILVLVDDTRPSQRAASVAVELTAAVGGHLVAVSVIDGSLASKAPAATGTSSVQAATATRLDGIRAAQDHLRRLADGTGLRGIDVRTIHSPAVDSLLLEAREAGADLVVVPSSNGSGGAAPVVAPAAELVLEGGEFPVLVVPDAR